MYQLYNCEESGKILEKININLLKYHHKIIYGLVYIFTTLPQYSEIAGIEIVSQFELSNSA